MQNQLFRGGGQPQPQIPRPPQGGQDQGPDPDPDLKNPDYLKALDLVQTKLYEEKGDAELAKALQASSNLEQALPEQAYLILQMVDDQMQGAVPDELYLMLGVDIMGELVEIAKASGMDVPGKVLAAAVKNLITTVVTDLGGDVSQVEQAMAQLPPEQVGPTLDTIEQGESGEQQLAPVGA